MVLIYDAGTCWVGVEGSDRIYELSGFVFVLLLVLWVDNDSRTQPAIYRTFEYGWLAFFYWIPYLPYYFWRTRGTRGLLIFGALIIVFFLGWLVSWPSLLAR